MRRSPSHRLWPVIAVLAFLLSATLVLELVTRYREIDAVIVDIPAGGDSVVADEPGDIDDPPPAPFLSEAHAAARQAAHRGQLGRAIILFEEALARADHDDRVHRDDSDSDRELRDASDVAVLRAEYGYWLLSAGRVRDAASALEDAAFAGPEQPWIAFTLGRARLRLGDVDGAESAFRRARTLRGDYTEAQIALADLLRARDEASEAVSLLEQTSATVAGDERARAMVALGRAYAADRRPSDAVRAFERALERAPAAVDIRVAVGRGFVAAGKLDRALAISSDTRAMAPDVPQVAAALGHALAKSGDRAGARAEYQRAVRLDPGYRYARRQLLRLALDDGDFVEARSHAEYLLELAPARPEHHFLAGLVAARQNKVAAAREHYQNAIVHKGGTYPEAFFNLGLAERRAGNLEAAIAAYQTALDQRQDYGAAQNNLGLAYAEAGEFSRARAMFAQLLHRDPQYAAAWLNLGKLLADQDRHDEAISTFRRALDARPGYPEARLNLGLAYRRTGELAEAVAIYEELVADRPRYVAAWHNLGIALHKQDRSAAAIAAFQRVTELHPGHLPAWRKLATLQLDSGELAVARQTAEELVDRAPGDDDARLLLAEVDRRARDWQRCVRNADIVLRQSPKHSRARALRKRCAR